MSVMATSLVQGGCELGNVNLWDQSSDLSDVPSLIDDCETANLGSLKPAYSSSSLHESPKTPKVEGRNQKKARRKGDTQHSFPKHQTYYTDDESETDDSLSSHAPTSLARSSPLSSLEMLPNEIIQKVAAWLEKDDDLKNLLLSSPIFLRTINDDHSETWRLRFLARYDHPIIDCPFDFSAAYKLRRLVLKNFTSFTNGLNERTLIQLEVIRDIILETYFKPKPWLRPPVRSLNLLAMGDPIETPWMLTFLSVPFPGITESRRYGISHCLFETLQIVLSHLLLSPISVLAQAAAGSREHYDIAKVYTFEHPFSLLYARLPREKSSPIPPAFRSKTFPNLRSPDPQPPFPRYKLDTSALLHIRNFWHRHLIRDHRSMTDYTTVTENTFSNMADALTKMQKLPQKWDRALNAKIQFPVQWFGTYSCLHPWPKVRKDLEERQSCAEDWNHVDPMMLDCVTTPDYELGFWPPELSSIPAFQDTVPEPLLDGQMQDPTTGPEAASIDDKSNKRKRMDENHGSGVDPIYIRGIASFVDTRTEREKENPEQDGQSSPTTPTRSPLEIQQSFLKNHPFNSLRVRGVVHDIPLESTVDNAPNAEDMAIPGWKRIVMVLYKPTVHYLVSVLEHAAEDYGGHTVINTATIWTTPAAGGATSAAATEAASNTMPAPASTTTTTVPSNATTQPIDPNTLHAHLQTRLYDLLTKHTASSSDTNPFSTPNIIALEDAFSPPHYLTWTSDTDIDYAYAYEGAVLPGSKIMLGRWWRCHGRDGLGPGREVDCHGDGVQFEAEPAGAQGQRDADTATDGGDVVMRDGQEPAPRTREFERGPFVFWAG